MIGDSYWSTGISIQKDDGKWKVWLDFLDNGWVPEWDATEGRLRVCYQVDDLTRAIDTLKADAERGRCPRIIGVLLRIVEGKGFGFIRPDDGSQEYFAHVTAFRDRNLFFEGARVSFRPGEPPGGRKAPPALDVDQASEEGNPDENDD